MEERLVVSASPHLRASDGIETVMWNVAAALVPAAAMGLYFFGLPALKMYLLGIVTAEATELACLKMRGKPLRYATDGSAFVTGLLLAMILPAGAAWYVPVVGAAFAVAIAKHTFGGLGHNVWNPALAGRVFLQFSYPQQVSLSQWTVPNLLWGRAPDAATMATPLAKEVGGAAAARFGYLDLLFGNGVGGSLGETCKIALLVGGVYLIARDIVDWRVPVGYIATVFVLTWLLPVKQGSPAWMGDPVYHVLAGGLIIGAFFMATDMVTTPVTERGRLIFGIGAGVLVSLIRRYGGYPEGVAYSIVLMNTVTPLIDRWVQPRVYGSTTAKPAPREG
ncbi:MAG: RnfABCDGE type electron transport complex subunit D [Planctomycetota bacterium]